MPITADKQVIIGVLKHQGELLEDYLQPQACYRCLLFALEALCRDTSILYSARSSCHAFWDACVRVLTAPRTEADIDILRSQIAKNVAKCCYKRQHTLKLAPGTDPVHLFIMVLYNLLRDGLLPTTQGHGILHGKDPKKMFVNSRLWPVRPNDFVPFGQRQSAEAHVRWCCELFAASSMRTLTCILIGYRPILFPSLLADDLRERLVWCVVQMLHADVGTDAFAWSARAGVSAQPPPGQRQRWLRESGGRTSVGVAARFLEIVLSGPDSNPDDGVRFSLGFERALLPAISTALDLVAGTAHLGESTIMNLSRWSYFLHARLDDSQPKPPLHEVAQRRILAWKESSQSNSGFWKFETIQTCLQKLYMTRTCSGPGCGKAIHETGAGRAFPLCAQCKFTQYCSRECQRADWKHPTEPHKEFCHMLRCILPALYGSVDEFKAAVHSSHSCACVGPSGHGTHDPESSKRFVDWIMARGRIANQVLKH